MSAAARIFVLLAMLSLSIVSSAFAQMWSFRGPFGASVNALAIDRWTPTTVYAGTELGLFITTDGGASWAFILAGPIAAVAVDPLSPSTIYAAGRNLLKSVDGGRTWRTLWGFGDFTAIAVDPWNAGTVYAAGARELLVKSTDGGAHWTNIYGSIQGGVISLTIDPWRPTIIYAGTSIRGVYKTHDGGASWYPSWAGLPLTSTLLPEVRTIAIDPWQPDVVYFADYHYEKSAIYKTTNGGWPWQVASLPPPISVGSLAIDPEFPAILYAGSGADGVFRSLDGAHTWSPVNSGLTSRQVTSIVVDRHTPSTLYAGTRDQGVFKSTNRGETWFAVNYGLFGMPMSDLAIDPWTSTMYATGSGGLFASTDEGATWTSLTEGIIKTTSATSPSGAYDVSLNSVGIDVWSPRTVYVATNMRDVLKSTDGGQQWASTLTPSEYYMPVTEIVLDSYNPGTIYAVSGDTVLKSVDAAANWSPAGPIPNGGYSAAVTALEIHPRNPDILYAVHRVFIPCYPSCSRTTVGLWISRDAGASWVATGAGLTMLSIGDRANIAIDPVMPENLYVSFGTSTVFRSTDGGQTWASDTQGLESSGTITELAIDPHAPSKVYAGTLYGVYESNDGGRTWAPLGSGLLGTVSTIAAHPWIRDVIYAGTSVGIFRLDRR